MFEKLDGSAGSVVGFRASGKLTNEDYKSFMPILEEVIEECGKVRMLWELVDFTGWELGAMWEDFKFATKHCRQVERLAMVGDKKWEEWMAKISAPFMEGEVRYFDRSELDAAWEWVRE